MVFILAVTHLKETLPGEDQRTHITMKPRYQSLILCLVLAVLCSVPPMLLLMRGGMESLAAFKDFIFSNLAFSGYNKRLELKVILLFLFCDFLLLPLLLWQRERILQLCRKLGFNELGRLGRIISQKLGLFLHSPLFDPKSGTFALVLLGFLYLLFLMVDVHTPAQKEALYPVIFTYLTLVCLLRERPELFSHVCMAGIGCYFSLVGIVVAVYPSAEFFNDVRLNAIPFCCAVAVALCLFLRSRASERERERECVCVWVCVAIAWAMVPCLLFALTRYTYIYEGEPVEIYKSWFSSSFFNILVVISLCCNIIAINFKKYSFVFLFSAICLATYLRWRLPNAVIPVDFFHGGELTTPFQQWKEFGKIPFIDYHPVHGLCDYFYSAIGYLFFDGSYSATNAGWAIGTSFQAALLILVLGLVYPNTYAVLLLAVFLPNLGMRLLAIGVCLPLSFWGFQRWNALWFFLWSGFCGLFCILWNVPQGLAFCGALAPLLAAKFWTYSKAPERPTRWQMVTGAMLCILLFALWPMLKALVLNTLLTAQISAEVHGNSVVQGVMAAPWLTTLKALFFIPFLAFLYIRALSSHSNASAMLLLPLSLTLFSLVYANYAFLRYDRGGRALEIGLLLIVASIPALHFRRPLIRFWGYAFLGIALYLNTPTPFPLAYHRLYEQQVQRCPTGLTMVTRGAEESIKNLGNGFIQPASLKLLKELQTYLAQNGNVFANFDSSLALYSILDTENPLKFQTAFNSGPIAKQRDSQNRIEKNDINSILLPVSYNDMARPLYYLQTQLYKNGFYPDAIIKDRYLFLKRSSPGASASQAALKNVRFRAEILALAHLPQVWAPACATWTQPVEVPYEMSLENCERAKGGFISPKGGTIRVTLHFAEPVSAKDFAFLMLSADTRRNNRMALVTTPDIADGKDGYSFWLGKHPGALPVFLNYAWLFAPDLKEICVEIRDLPPKKAFTLDIGFRRFRVE